MQITVDIPEQYLLDQTPSELARRLALSMALLMFRAGEISAGAACELAGIDRLAFAAACEKYGIPLISYPPEDLAAELESLRMRVGAPPPALQHTGRRPHLDLKWEPRERALADPAVTVFETTRDLLRFLKSEVRGPKSGGTMSGARP